MVIPREFSSQTYLRCGSLFTKSLWTIVSSLFVFEWLRPLLVSFSWIFYFDSTGPFSTMRFPGSSFSSYLHIFSPLSFFFLVWLLSWPYILTCHRPNSFYTVFRRFIQTCHIYALICINYRFLVYPWYVSDFVFMIFSKNLRLFYRTPTWLRLWFLSWRFVSTVTSLSRQEIV